MNRAYRRAIARTERLASVRQTHKIPPQCCALWVPAAQGYVRHFSTQGFGVIELASLARHYAEDEASSAAIAFREITGLRVVVRPVYLQQITEEIGPLRDAGHSRARPFELATTAPASHPDVEPFDLAPIRSIGQSTRRPFELRQKK